LLADEALDILELKPGATLTEIKRSYHDLVKVWHPDRFGTDPRLRQKAEDKLKQLNDAYQALRSPTTGDAAKRPPAPVRPVPPRSRAVTPRRVVLPAWFLTTLLAMLVTALAVFAVREVKSVRSEIQRTESAPRTENPGPARPVDLQPARTAPAANPKAGNAAAPFRIQPLSDADSAQLEAACGSLKDLPDRSAYQTCLTAQLAAITNSPGPPDLSSLDSSEHESIESACSGGAHFQGQAAYDHCLAVQMAELAASPARPDLSGLNGTDRASIERACSGAKARGPGAYNHCRIRLVELLEHPK
jgi:hypothetical protein